MDINQLLLDQQNSSAIEHSAAKLLKDLPLIVYGYGEGYTALERTVLDPFGIKPEYVLDNKLNEKRCVEGITYCDAKSFKEEKHNGKIFNLVLTIGDREIAGEIISDLKCHAIKNAFWAPDIYEYSLHHFCRTDAAKFT